MLIAATVLVVVASAIAGPTGSRTSIIDLRDLPGSDELQERVDTAGADDADSVVLLVPHASGESACRRDGGETDEHPECALREKLGHGLLVTTFRSLDEVAVDLGGDEGVVSNSKGAATFTVDRPMTGFLGALLAGCFLTVLVAVLGAVGGLPGRRTPKPLRSNASSWQPSRTPPPDRSRTTSRVLPAVTSPGPVRPGPAPPPRRRRPPTGPLTRTFVSNAGGYTEIDGVLRWSVVEGPAEHVLGPNQEVDVVDGGGEVVVVRRRVPS
ncbi:hypothetical protein GCM10023215_01510 [Pseudonocardia yuanmonensis]|uniref:NfeD-like C-terminal domain-containing protein n=1 Tax=Pseudonocardia yuanmonensis TaxID=1095914 RepID=A0ABP8VVA9_9PSEU